MAYTPLERSVLLALTLMAPGWCLAQETVTPSANAPAVSAPTGGLPVALLQGAALPALDVSIPGLNGTALPASYTRFGAAVGIGASDNVNLSPTDRKSQALADANLFFNLLRSGSRLQLSALGNFSDINYLEHAYSNQLLGRFDGFANLTLWQHHLTWLVRDDYGDSQVDALQALTPSNLQRVNIFSTGPTLMLQPTLSTFVELQALYSRDTYQNQPFDGQSESGSVSVGHQFSELSSISLVGQVEQQRFDNRAVNVNYQVREYYADYKVQGARTSLDFQGGMDQANDTGAWRSSPMVRLSVSRNVSPFSMLSLSGGRQYANAMGNFASLATGASGAIPVGPVTQTTANAIQTYGNLNWGFHRLRTTLNLFGGWQRSAYDRQAQFNRTQADVGLTLARDLTPRLQGSLTVTANRSRYAAQALTDNYGTASASLAYRPGRWLVVYGTYEHTLRRPTGPAAQGLGFDENRVFIMLGYYPHSSGTGMPGMGGMGGMGLGGGMP